MKIISRTLNTKTKLACAALLFISSPVYADNDYLQQALQIWQDTHHGHQKPPRPPVDQPGYPSSPDQPFQSALIPGTPVYDKYNNDTSPIEVVKSVVLTPADIKTGHGYLIRNSNITLDCNGLTIEGHKSAMYGVSIDSQGRPISNITVKNCTFNHFKQDGINVGWILPDGKKRAIAPTDDGLYALHPSNVTLSNNTYLNSGNSGVYVNAFSQHVTVQDSTFRDNNGPSIYLEYSSKFSRILNSKFIHNGLANREAIAIDSSTDNLIQGNTFDGNLAGGIFLYKNCGERHVLSQIAVKRTLGANRNLIKNNTFRNEKVGVWIAARQSRDLGFQLCTDPVIHDGNDGKFYQDFSKNNHVTNNAFCNVDQAVIVEDDNNIVDDNNLGNAQMNRAVTVTTPPRARFLNMPIIGTKIQNNFQGQCN
jgi:parallel beta-helix repeat protein